MKIFVIAMVLALATTFIIDGCISKSSAVPSVRVAKKTERVISWLGKRFGGEYREIIEIRKRSPQEFARLDSYENVPSAQLEGDEKYVIFPESLRGRFVKDLRDSLDYIAQRRQEMITDNFDQLEMLTKTREWRKAFANNDVVSISQLNENIDEITKIEEELLFAVNSHDVAARLATKSPTEVKKHLNKIKELLVAYPRAYLQIDLLDSQGAVGRQLTLSASSTDEEIFEIFRQYLHIKRPSHDILR